MVVHFQDIANLLMQLQSHCLQSDQHCILELKACVVGVAANHVFLLEPSMDPAILQQAVGRAHRMGQTRPVHVTRLIMHSTVEVRPQLLHLSPPCFKSPPPSTLPLSTPPSYTSNSPPAPPRIIASSRDT